MGEAKIRQRRRANFFEVNPFCCYCGGDSVASEIDHVPSRQMFSLRQRPKGLEVPACSPCNRSAAPHEQVAAMLGRVYPDGPTEAERHEMHEIMGAVHENVPGLLEEMLPSFRQGKKFRQAKLDFPNVGGVLNCSGPLLNESIQLFGAKLGFALHYNITGRIVPAAGAIAIRWYSNFDRVSGEIPNGLLQILGEPRTLQQGKNNVGNQFSYAYAILESDKMAVYFSTFRQSFAVASFVSEGLEDFPEVEGMELHQPGCFRFSTD